MTIILQVSASISRKEMAQLVHDALNTARVPYLGVSSSTDDIDYLHELAEDPNPPVANFRFKNNTNAVIYTRDVRQYWSCVREGRSPHRAKEPTLQRLLDRVYARPNPAKLQIIDRLERQLERLGIAPDASLTFPTGSLTHHGALSSERAFGRGEAALKHIASHILYSADKVQKAAYMLHYCDAHVVVPIKHQ